ncbi:MAG: hypothetical protein GY832_45085 [Chloroflexi bacterium]|nr:hypothetical protein [Chloroflexota bacterium]
MEIQVRVGRFPLILEKLLVEKPKMALSCTAKVKMRIAGIVEGHSITHQWVDLCLCGKVGGLL